MDVEKDPEKPTPDAHEPEVGQIERSNLTVVEPVHINHAHKFIYGYIILLLFAALAGVGTYLYHRYHDKPVVARQSAESKSQAAKVDPYSGWNTYTLTGEGYSFRYPNNWSAKSLTNGAEITSPVANGYDFVVEMLSGVEQSVDLNFLGNSPGTTISKLSLERDNQPYYLVAPAISGKTTGLGLATTPGGESTSFGVIDTGGDNNVTMVAFLVPMNEQPTGNNSYTVQMYQQQPNYQTLLKIFQSLSYRAPVPNTVSTASGEISLALPKTWEVMANNNNPKGTQVISKDTSTQVCKYGTCGTAGCLDVDDPVSCTYEAEFQPISLESLNQKAINNTWELRVEKTDWTLQQAVYSRVGELNASNTVAENNNPINGYQTEYLEVKGGDCGGECYIDVYYFIEDKGYLLTFYNREEYKNVSVNPIDENYSAYEPDFAKIINSVQLKL